MSPRKKKNVQALEGAENRRNLGNLCFYPDYFKIVNKVGEKQTSLAVLEKPKTCELQCKALNALGDTEDSILEMSMVLKNLKRWRLEASQMFQQQQSLKLRGSKWRLT